MTLRKIGIYRDFIGGANVSDNVHERVLEIEIRSTV